jgi:hypothetical protein
MESATVHTAAQTTGWSVRMLHYLDAAGLPADIGSTASGRSANSELCANSWPITTSGRLTCR